MKCLLNMNSAAAGGGQQKSTGRASVAAAVTLVIVGLAVSTALAAEPQSLADMDLESLLNLEVTSVSRKVEPLSSAAAAVYVITAEDIRRSGVTTIADALRMAPGMNVAQIDCNKWAVSTRGFNGFFSSKLLVLIDGRSVYTPLFSGVYWDVQDVVLADVDRIEIIRGPGATMWGANAVNGVINVITKEAAGTQGLLVSASTGTTEKGSFQARYGGTLPNGVRYRVFGKGFDRGPFEDALGRDNADDWSLAHGGFRIERDQTLGGTVTLEGDVYSGKTSGSYLFPASEVPYVTLVQSRGDLSGGNVLVNWKYANGNRWDATILGYADQTQRKDGFSDQLLRTFNIEGHQNISLSRRISVTWGMDYRHTEDRINPTVYTTFDPGRMGVDLISALAQTQVSLIPGRLQLTTGVKVEKTRFASAEWQPTVRLAWEPTPSHTIWGAVSKAVRTPSRGERYADIWLASIPPFSLANPTPVPLAVDLVGSSDFRSERLTAVEAGYRWKSRRGIMFDAAGFYHSYRDLAQVRTGTPPIVATATGLALPLYLTNDGSAEAYGGECAVEWQPARPVRAKLTYSYLDGEYRGLPAEFQLVQGGIAPEHQIGALVFVTPRPWLDVDVWLRYVGAVPQMYVPDYVTLDTRVAVRLPNRLLLSGVGRNLIGNHQEFRGELFGVTSEVGRRFDVTLAFEM